MRPPLLGARAAVARRARLRHRAASPERRHSPCGRRGTMITRLAHAAMSCSCVTRQIVMPRSWLRRLEEREHLEARTRVEVAGRLVGEEERRIGHERASDGDALLLTAGELARRVMHAVGERHRRREPLRARAPLAQRRTPRYCSGSSTFSSAVVRGSRLNPWKMKPMSRLRTMARASLLRAPTSISDEHVRAARRPVEAAEDVHQRRLARAALPDDGDELAVVDGDVDVAQRMRRHRRRRRSPSTRPTSVDERGGGFRSRSGSKDLSSSSSVVELVGDDLRAERERVARRAR